MLKIQQHWKAICAVILIFFGGFILGIVGSAYYFKYKIKRLSDPSSMKRIIDGRFNKMSKQLNLTPEQINIIKPIVEESALEMKHIREQTNLKLRQMRRSQVDRIIKVLTPEQIQQFKMMAGRRSIKENADKIEDNHLKPDKNDSLASPTE